MSYIKKLIGNKSFEELKNELKKEPYFLEIKEDNNKYMLLFTEKSDLTLPEVRECTGIIFEKETNQLLHFSFPKCYEGTKESEGTYSSKIKGTERTELYNVSDLKNYKINLYFTGSIIKLYFFNDGWQIASSKNLDASKSFWGSKKSFKELFIDAIEISEDIEYFDFIEKLDVNCCYTYIIQHPENCSLIKVKTPLAFILNKVNVETLKEEIPDIDNMCVEKSLQDVLYNKKGVTENYLIYNLNKDGNVISRVKVLSNEYEKVKELYGNYPDIGLRYIEVYENELLKKELRQTFINDISKFNKIDILYNKAIKCIEMSYKNVYINESRTLNDIPKSHVPIIQYIKQNSTSIIEYLKNKNSKQVAYIIMYTY
jgi:hypothetical protein